jgi:uncharacterized protein with PQ loop repeat
MGANIYHPQLHQKRHHRKAPIDRLVYAAVILGPLMTLPQVWQVWAAKQQGVSLTTWLAYCIIAAIWLMYGLKHREKPIIYVQLSWLVLDALIVVGLLVKSV